MELLNGIPVTKDNLLAVKNSIRLLESEIDKFGDISDEWTAETIEKINIYVDAIVCLEEMRNKMSLIIYPVKN